MTHRITREQFDGPDRRLGGDFWNAWQIAAQAFRVYPAAREVTWDYIGTGLWVDARVDGKATRLYS